MSLTTAMVVIAIALLLFVLSIFMERLTPSTSQAVVQDYVVRMTPEVAGRVIEVGVVDNASVLHGGGRGKGAPVPHC
jgi:multidrug resistance efflux pump